MKQVHSLKEQYQKSEQDMQDCMKKCQETSQRYERLYQKYFEEQAGILARELQEGEPCPVCGSCSHPKKAVLSGGAPKKSRWSVQKQCGIRQKKSVQKFWNGFRQ